MESSAESRVPPRTQSRAQSPAPSRMDSERFALYVSELRQFSSSHQLPCGSPVNLHLLLERLDSIPVFRAECASMLRSVFYREHGAAPPEELLMLLIVAWGGEPTEPPTPRLQATITALLRFAVSVMRTPTFPSELPHPDLPQPELPHPDLPQPDLPRPDLSHPEPPPPDISLPRLPRQEDPFAQEVQRLRISQQAAATQPLTDPQPALSAHPPAQPPARQAIDDTSPDNPRPTPSHSPAEHSPTRAELAAPAPPQPRHAPESPSSPTQSHPPGSTPDQPSNRTPSARPLPPRSLLQDSPPTALEKIEAAIQLLAIRSPDVKHYLQLLKYREAQIAIDQRRIAGRAAERFAPSSRPAGDNADSDSPQQPANDAAASLHSHPLLQPESCRAIPRRASTPSHARVPTWAPVTPPLPTRHESPWDDNSEFQLQLRRFAAERDARMASPHIETSSRISDAAASAWNRLLNRFRHT